jgi:hypothetical protein
MRKLLNNVRASTAEARYSYRAARNALFRIGAKE